MANVPFFELIRMSDGVSLAVLVILSVMSIGTWGIILIKWKDYHKNTSANADFYARFVTVEQFVQLKGLCRQSIDSPLKKLTEVVILENTTFLKGLISDCFNSVIKTEDFKKSIITAFSHKVARSIISNNDGLFEKVSNELKQDAIFKSKMSLAVSNVVEECLTERRC